MKVIFRGCGEDQKNWGGNTGDIAKLIVGKIYTVKEVEEHSWYTKYFLEEAEGSFNSICFDEATL